jgi:putative transposase
MEVYNVGKFEVEKGSSLHVYCNNMTFKSKNLYNATNYIIRQVYTNFTSKKTQVSHQETMDLIDKNLDQMNVAPRKSYKKKLDEMKTKPKRNEKGEVIVPTLHLFEMPTNEKKFVNYNFAEALFKVTNNVDYRSLPAQCNQQTMKDVFDDWKSFFEGLKAYGLNPSKFTGKPKMPRYKNKNGRSKCTFTGQICKIVDEQYLTFPKTDLRLNLGDLAKGDGILKEVRIIPTYDFFTIEVVFAKVAPNAVVRDKKKDKNAFVFTPKRLMMIDLGVNNLATITDTIGGQPILIKGKVLKSLNQFYNKQRAYYMGELRKGKNPDEGPFTSNMLQAIDAKRERQVHDYLHKASSMTVQIAVARKIDTIIIGKNVGWKQGEMKLKKRDKQNFINIPHAKFIEMVRYKAERLGIQVVAKEESYTSQASFFHDDFIPTYGASMTSRPRFSGYRKNREFYKFKGIKRYVHSDVNGSFNIGRKHCPDLFASVPKIAVFATPKAVLVWQTK